MYLSIFILVSKTRSCFVRLSFGNINLLKIFIFFPRIAHIENIFLFQFQIFLIFISIFLFLISTFYNELLQVYISDPRHVA